MGSQTLRFENRAHFFAAATEAMRRILIDRARRKLAQRRGGRCEHVPIDGRELAAPEAEERLLAVSEALDKLAQQHPVQAEVVKLRYFRGLTNEETAQMLGISLTTTKKYWTFARTWLLRGNSEQAEANRHGKNREIHHDNPAAAPNKGAASVNRPNVNSTHRGDYP